MSSDSLSMPTCAVTTAATTAATTLEAAAGPYAWIPRIAREWGIFAAMSAFFIWQGAVREGALNKQIADQQKFTQDTLVSLIQKNTEAFQTFKATLEQKK